MSNIEGRAFKNPFPDYGKSAAALQILDPTHKRMSAEFKAQLINVTASLKELLESHLNDLDWSDDSVYTGISGIAMLYLFMASKENNQQDLQICNDLLIRALPLLRGRNVSFLIGDSGALSIMAALYMQLGQPIEAQGMANRVLALMPVATNLKGKTPDEVLYGRAGYLYSLLYLQKYVGTNALPPQRIRQVVEAILESGQELAGNERSRCPLFYRWHDTPYVGAAHGIVGILHLLLQARLYLQSDELTHLVQRSIDYLLTIRYPTGNLPSSIGSSTDKLLHWCHGAPGAVHLFCLAFEVFGEERYLQAALACGEVVWKYGILKKGYGICHGVSGNAYTFLALFQLTKNPKYLYRALRFAEWCFDYGKHGCRTPDTPWSLFEGLAGTIYFLVDLLNPNEARFPAFVL